MFMDKNLLFFSTFIKYPKEIGSVVPSSKFLIKELLKNIDFKNAACIVEYGPGTGCITTEILKRARKDCRVFCFEINKKLVAYLEKNFDDKRLRIINSSAEHISKHLKAFGIEQADFVISSLPFSVLPDYEKLAIIKETRNTLKNNGKFIVYQYLNNFKKYLYNYFSNISIKFVPINIPPAFVYVCEK